MQNIWTISSREYKKYFSSPAAYVAAFLVLLVVGVLFYLTLRLAELQQVAIGVEAVLQPLAFMLMLVTPALTASLLAGERSSGTIELLQTAPVRDSELVIGKWLGALFFMLSILAVTLLYPLLLNQLVDPGIDQGPLITGYLGLLLLCAAMAAIGVFISSLFNSQVAAFLTTLLVLVLLWWLFGFFAQAASATGGAGTLVRYLDLQSHFYNNFLPGSIDLRDVVYFLSLTALGLFFGTLAVEVRRWG